MTTTIRVLVLMGVRLGRGTQERAFEIACVKVAETPAPGTRFPVCGKPIRAARPWFFLCSHTRGEFAGYLN